MLEILGKLIDSKKKLKNYHGLISKINQLEKQFASFSKENCTQKTLEFKGLIQTVRLTPRSICLSAKSSNGYHRRKAF